MSLVRPVLSLFPIAISIGILIYGGLCIFLRLRQNHFIFFPAPASTVTPEAIGLQYEDVWLSVPGKTDQIHGWWVPAANSGQDQSPTLLYLHGNGGNVGSNLASIDRFHRLGFSVLVIDYRGYGRSHGDFPSEASIYQDVELAWTYLVQTRQVEPSNITIFGHSLGGAIAVDIASQHPEVAALIIQSSFTSMANMATEVKGYSLFPIDRLLTQRFDSWTKLPHLSMPIFFIHGIEDATVPAYMSEQLHAIAPNSQLWLVPVADHNDVAEVAGEDYLSAIQHFMDQMEHQPSQTNV